MALLATVSALAAGVLPVVDDPSASYTPAQFGTDLTASVVQILPYVGIAVGGSIGIMFALVGIRKGISWARSLTSKG